MYLDVSSVLAVRRPAGPAGGRSSLHSSLYRAAWITAGAVWYIGVWPALMTSFTLLSQFQPRLPLIWLQILSGPEFLSDPYVCFYLANDKNGKNSEGSNKTGLFQSLAY